MDRRFAPTDMDAAQQRHVDNIREAASRFAESIEQNAPHCRERSVALTELETSAMWAVKAVTHGARGS